MREPVPRCFWVFFDMFLVIVFGIIGYILKKTGFEPGPMVLAFVLGSMLEVVARQSLLLFDGNIAGFVTRPISGGLLLMIVITVAMLPVIKRLRDRRVAITEAVESGHSENAPELIIDKDKK